MYMLISDRAFLEWSSFLYEIRTPFR